MEKEATITSKGQVTIPKGIREHLGLKTGAKIVFEERLDGVVIKPKIKDPVSKLRGLRKTIKISEKDIDVMIQESKKAWS